MDRSLMLFTRACFRTSLSRLLLIPSTFSLVLGACTVDGMNRADDTDSPQGGGRGESGDGDDTDDDDESHAEGCPLGTEIDGVTLRGDSICSNCDSGVYCPGGDRPAQPCDDGTWDNDSDPSTGCVQLTACASGSYVSTPGGGTQDQTCDECELYTFSDQKNATICTPYRACSAGQEWSDLSKKQDAACADCPRGTWDDDSDPATPCVEHSACLPGEYEVKSGDGSQDRDCDACLSGTFAAQENAPQCTVWSTCPWGVLEPGTPSSDVECRVPVDIAAGFAHSCAAFNDGTVQCWGDNKEGQLGNDTMESSFSPLAVAGISSATSIASLATRNCVVLESGEVECWGQPQAAIPQGVGGITAATQVSVGYTFACATQSGSVQCWGTNAFGQLGNGETESSSVPVTVSGATKVTSLATGDGHACAINDGSVQCWGFNAYGQLGVGTETDIPVPITISSLTGAKSIAAGLYHSCAVLAGGEMQCWGNNEFGQLGDGTKIDTTTPGAVSQLSGVARAYANWHHTCAVRTDRSVQCWGRNTDGQLGDGSTTSSSVPVAVEGIGDVADMAVGEHHTCALTTGQDIYCWGDNTIGQLGRLTTGLYSETPILVLPAPN